MGQDGSGDDSARLARTGGSARDADRSRSGGRRRRAAWIPAAWRQLTGLRRRAHGTIAQSVNPGRVKVRVPDRHPRARATRQAGSVLVLGAHCPAGTPASRHRSRLSLPSPLTTGGLTRQYDRAALTSRASRRLRQRRAGAARAGHRIDRKLAGPYALEPRRAVAPLAPATGPRWPPTRVRPAKSGPGATPTPDSGTFAPTRCGAPNALPRNPGDRPGSDLLRRRPANEADRPEAGSSPDDRAYHRKAAAMADRDRQARAIVVTRIVAGDRAPSPAGSASCAEDVPAPEQAMPSGDRDGE